MNSGFEISWYEPFRTRFGHSVRLLLRNAIIGVLISCCLCGIGFFAAYLALWLMVGSSFATSEVMQRLIRWLFVLGIGMVWIALVFCIRRMLVPVRITLSKEGLSDSSAGKLIPINRISLIEVQMDANSHNIMYATYQYDGLKETVTFALPENMDIDYLKKCIKVHIGSCGADK